MNKGFIFLEVIISLTLIAILIIPLYRFASSFTRLENHKNERVELLNDISIKKKLSLGYSTLLLENDSSIGEFSNIGMISDSEVSNDFIFFKIKDKSFNRDIFYILTPAGEYGGCL